MPIPEIQERGFARGSSAKSMALKIVGVMKMNDILPASFGQFWHLVYCKDWHDTTPTAMQKETGH